MEALDTNLNTEPPGSVNEKGVLFGHKGFLFLSRTKSQEGRWLLPLENSLFDGILKTILLYRANAEAHGTRYFAIAQGPESFVNAAHYPRAPNVWITDHPKLADCLLHDATPRLIATCGKSFYKTDVHLTPWGAIEMALVLAETTGLANPSQLAYLSTSLPKMVRERAEPFIGETGGRCSPPQSELGFRFVPPIEIKAAAFDGRPEFTHRHPQEGDLVVTQSEQALIDKTVLIFGSSFVNAMLGPLSMMFSKVIWARSMRYVYWDLVKASKPDCVVSWVQGRGQLDAFPNDDEAPPPFFSTSKHTKRKLAMREKNKDLFVDTFPGALALAHSKHRPSSQWIASVMGSRNYVQDTIRPRIARAEIGDSGLGKSVP
jgi:hypothetical protein